MSENEETIQQLEALDPYFTEVLEAKIKQRNAEEKRRLVTTFICQSASRLADEDIATQLPIFEEQWNDWHDQVVKPIFESGSTQPYFESDLIRTRLNIQVQKSSTEVSFPLQLSMPLVVPPNLSTSWWTAKKAIGMAQSIDQSTGLPGGYGYRNSTLANLLVEAFQPAGLTLRERQVGKTGLLRRPVLQPYVVKDEAIEEATANIYKVANQLGTSAVKHVEAYFEHTTGTGAVAAVTVINPERETPSMAYSLHAPDRRTTQNLVKDLTEEELEAALNSELLPSLQEKIISAYPGYVQPNINHQRASQYLDLIVSSEAFHRLIGA
ncbi:MAG TPA: hypothetical protein VMR95_00070 [Candidatus Binatia bacterium]|nr:hypothetical protein [Candidatus Binatia bacterium]